MSGNRLFNVFVVVSLVVMAVFTIRLVVATTEVVSGGSVNATTTLDQRERSASQNNEDHVRSYRSPLDECFDVLLREACDKWRDRG